MPSFRDTGNAAVGDIYSQVPGEKEKAGILGGGVDDDPLSPFDLTFQAKKDWRVELGADDEWLQ